MFKRNRISDKLFKYKTVLETFLYTRKQTLFDFEEVITLYDLTNTYFEGVAATNREAQYGHSKEKHTDCPLITLALVLDASGFPKSSEIFPGNAKEAETLEKMLTSLGHDTLSPTVVLNAGIATEDNVVWLNAHDIPLCCGQPQASTPLRSRTSPRVASPRVGSFLLTFQDQGVESQHSFPA